MSEGKFIPPQWCSMPVSEVVSNIPQKQYLETGTYPVVDQGQSLIGGYSDDEEALVDCSPPVIIFGDHTKVVKFVKFRFAPGADGIKVLKPHDFFDCLLFKYFIDHITAGLINKGYARHYQHLANSQIPLPPPAEQRRIVAKIEELFSELDQGIANLKQARAQLAVYRQALLKHAFEGKLTADWRATQADQLEPADQLLSRISAERRRLWEENQIKSFTEAGKTPSKDWKAKYKEPIGPAPTKLPLLPSSWCWATVGQLSTKVVDGVHKKPNYVKEGVPFVTVRNLTAGSRISFKKLNYITSNDHTEFIKRANPERDDILISKDGTLGVVRAISCDTVFSIFVSVALIKPVITKHSRYITLALTSPQVQIQMVPKGSGLAHIHLEDLRQDLIPFAPLPEQDVIVEMVERLLSAISVVETDIDLNLQKAEALRQSILKKAFAGALVPQDPNDEPASVLLARICAEREAAAAAVAKVAKPRKAKKP